MKGQGFWSERSEGYWGDIVSSPYFSFGVDVDARIIDNDKKALAEAV